MFLIPMKNKINKNFRNRFSYNMVKKNSNNKKNKKKKMNN